MCTLSPSNSLSSNGSRRVALSAILDASAPDEVLNTATRATRPPRQTMAAVSAQRQYDAGQGTSPGGVPVSPIPALDFPPFHLRDEVNLLCL